MSGALTADLVTMLGFVGGLVAAILVVVVVLLAVSWFVDGWIS